MWLNEYFGPIVNASGKPFEELPAYADNKETAFTPRAAARGERGSHVRPAGYVVQALTFAQAWPGEYRLSCVFRSPGCSRSGKPIWPQIERVSVMDPRKLREALRKQGIFVHESDPILEMAAICEAAMAETLKAIEASNRAAVKSLPRLTPFSRPNSDPFGSR